jgi:hypothetical protein
MATDTKSPEQRAREIDEAIRVADAARKKDEEQQRERGFPGEQLDKLLKGIDTITGSLADMGRRLDALEKSAPGDGKHLPRHVGKGEPNDDDGDDGDVDAIARGEPKRVVADDDRRRDDIVADHAARQAEAVALSDAQYRAEQACASWGGSAPKPMQGERVLDYRRRCLRPWVKYSKEFGAVDVSTLDEPLLTPVEARVYADAIAASSDPAIAPAGMLRMIQRRDETGRTITEWMGEPRVWMQQWAGARRRVIGIRNVSSH